MCKLLQLLPILFLLCCNPQKSINYTEKNCIRISVNLLNDDFVQNTNFEQDSIWDDEYAFGYIDGESLSDVLNDYPELVDVLDEDAFRRHPFDRKTLKILSDPPGAKEYEDYHDYAELTAELEHIESEYPELAQLFTAGKSVDRKELWYMKLSDNVASDEPEPKLLYIANMHGDETVGRELMIYLIRLLVTKHGDDPYLTHLVDNAQIFIMPSMNPDGFERARRYNANGVDLNRDFPDFINDPNDTPTGRAIETQHIMRMHDEHHFHLAVNYHGGALCINIVWDSQPNTEGNKFAEDELQFAIAREYTEANEPMYNGGFDHGLTYGYEWYPIHGGMQDWATYYRQSMHAAIELSNTKYPNASQLPRYWEDNRDAMIDYLYRGLRGLHLKVVNEQGLAVPNVQMTWSGRTLSYPTGLINRMTSDGEQDFVLEAEGYQSAEFKLDAKLFDGLFQPVVLTK